ncbi:MAG: hypothetical protein PHP30_00920 [Bacteroidales bacterium]|nr:hypothetical protein [Bacteroidales bacterium]MDD2425043.1 hypothetical protein [Bacteroidales bacterium]MDD3988648.1 hypothetical protein [Bacteroidales bacterium]MDD4638330.1 hypothetical protein [Bacteroidales bacterium]
MKSALKIIPALTLLLFYLMAASGFGIHECRTRGTIDVLPVIYGNGCEDIHKDHSEASGCNGGCCSSSDITAAESSEGGHTDECCTTEVHKLGCDYESSQQLTISPEKSLELIHLFLATLSDYLSDTLFPWIDSSCSLTESPPPVKCGTYSYISQWRL